MGDFDPYFHAVSGMFGVGEGQHMSAELRKLFLAYRDKFLEGPASMLDDDARIAAFVKQVKQEERNTDLGRGGSDEWIAMYNQVKKETVDGAGGQEQQTSTAYKKRQEPTGREGYFIPNLALGETTTGKNIGRGLIRNPGGGLIDTQVATDIEQGTGDYIGQGPQNKEVAAKTLRARFQEAGTDSVVRSEFDNLQSDAIFETFSWVPDGYGLGPNNHLEKLNKMHNVLRFGHEPLWDPRPTEPTVEPHPFPKAWTPTLSFSEIGAIMFKDVPDSMNLQKEAFLARRYPYNNFEGSQNNIPDARAARRSADAPNHFKPRLWVSSSFKGAFNPPQRFSNKRFREQFQGTWETI